MRDRAFQPLASRILADVDFDDIGQPREEQPVGLALATEKAAYKLGRLSSTAQSHLSKLARDGPFKRGSGILQPRRRSVDKRMGRAMRQNDDFAARHGDIRRARILQERATFRHQMKAHQSLGPWR